jgi:hypothetical protein
VGRKLVIEVLYKASALPGIHSLDEHLSIRTVMNVSQPPDSGEQGKRRHASQTDQEERIIEFIDQLV